MALGQSSLLASDGEGVFARQPFHQQHPEICKVGRRTAAAYQPRTRSKPKQRVFYQPKPDKIGGEHRWRCLRERDVVPYRNKPGFKSWSRKGAPDGLSKEEARKARQRAKRIAVKLMNKLMHNYDLDDEMAQRALLGLLEIGACEANPVAERGKAFAKVLEYVKARPVAQPIAPMPMTVAALPSAQVVDASLAFLTNLPSPVERADD